MDVSDLANLTLVPLGAGNGINITSNQADVTVATQLGALAYLNLAQNANLGLMAADTVKANITANPAAPQDVSLSVFSQALQLGALAYLNQVTNNLFVNAPANTVKGNPTNEVGGITDINIPNGSILANVSGMLGGVGLPGILSLLGSGTPSASTSLYGDGVWRSNPYPVFLTDTAGYSVSTAGSYNILSGNLAVTSPCQILVLSAYNLRFLYFTDQGIPDSLTPVSSVLWVNSQSSLTSYGGQPYEPGVYSQSNAQSCSANFQVINAQLYTIPVAGSVPVHVAVNSPGYESGVYIDNGFMLGIVFPS